MENTCLVELNKMKSNGLCTIFTAKFYLLPWRFGIVIIRNIIISHNNICELFISQEKLGLIDGKRRYILSRLGGGGGEDWMEDGKISQVLIIM